eukprot:scaffold225877_cov22-Tisochrysis_lutea.AAC.1
MPLHQQKQGTGMALFPADQQTLSQTQAASAADQQSTQARTSHGGWQQRMGCGSAAALLPPP